MILLPLHPASLMHKYSQGRRIIDGLHPLECNDWLTQKMLKNAQFVQVILNNTVKRVILSTHKRLRISSGRIIRTISMQILQNYFFLKQPCLFYWWDGHSLCLPYMESMWPNQDGRQLSSKSALNPIGRSPFLPSWNL